MKNHTKNLNNIFFYLTRDVMSALQKALCRMEIEQTSNYIMMLYLISFLNDLWI